MARLSGGAEVCSGVPQPPAPISHDEPETRAPRSATLEAFGPTTKLAPGSCTPEPSNSWDRRHTCARTAATGWHTRPSPHPPPPAIVRDVAPPPQRLRHPSNCFLTRDEPCGPPGANTESPDPTRTLLDARGRRTRHPSKAHQISTLRSTNCSHGAQHVREGSARRVDETRLSREICVRQEPAQEQAGSRNDRLRPTCVRAKRVRMPRTGPQGAKRRDVCRRATSTNREPQRPQRSRATPQTRRTKAKHLSLRGCTCGTEPLTSSRARRASSRAAAARASVLHIRPAQNIGLVQSGGASWGGTRHRRRTRTK